MPEKPSKPPNLAPPSATGNAGPQFEAKVGAFYALSLLAGGEPRGLPGAVTRAVAFQQRGSGHPLDDVMVQADNADGSSATLEIQAKRTLTFTASDDEFKDVVSQIWQAAQKPEFETTRYELAVAMARTTTRVEHSCQEALHWARQLPDGATFAAHINREKFASDGMRNFVAVFRANLAAVGAPTDDETVWRLLRRFQILVFDFESPGSDYEHRARERARLVLKPDQADRAADLWPVPIDYVGACARAGGSRDRAAVVEKLRTEHGFQFDQRADLQVTTRQLAETALQALDEIKDQVGGVSLARTELVDQADAALETKRVLHIVGAPGVGKSFIMKRLAKQLEPEGRIIVLRNGRIIPGGWLPMAHMIGCAVSRDELFNELGCGGGATLFIDNIDLIDEPGDWATITDLLTGVSRSPGWRAVVTGGIGNDEWKTRLPTGLSVADIAVLAVGEITDDETAVLASGNAALAMLLSTNYAEFNINSADIKAKPPEGMVHDLGPGGTVLYKVDPQGKLVLDDRGNALPRFVPKAEIEARAKLTEKRGSARIEAEEASAGTRNIISSARVITQQPGFEEALELGRQLGVGNIGIQNVGEVDPAERMLQAQRASNPDDPKFSVFDSIRQTQRSLELMAGRAFLKGQGQVSNFERSLVSDMIGNLPKASDKADWQFRLNTLDRMIKDMNAGREVKDAYPTRPTVKEMRAVGEAASNQDTSTFRQLVTGMATRYNVDVDDMFEHVHLRIGTFERTRGKRQGTMPEEPKQPPYGRGR